MWWYQNNFLKIYYFNIFLNKKYFLKRIPPKLQIKDSHARPPQHFCSFVSSKTGESEGKLLRDVLFSLVFSAFDLYFSSGVTDNPLIRTGYLGREGGREGGSPIHIHLLAWIYFLPKWFNFLSTLFKRIYWDMITSF